MTDKRLPLLRVIGAFTAFALALRLLLFAHAIDLTFAMIAALGVGSVVLAVTRRTGARILLEVAAALGMAELFIETHLAYVVADRHFDRRAESDLYNALIGGVFGWILAAVLVRAYVVCKRMNVKRKDDRR